ncbi:MAG: undecaprenyldiphospho-muramoylpentapeptide beta-N-acetylglucosaminyltransferase [Rhodothermales bacterium]
MKNERAPRVLFAGGGSGGHVYPAIAIADAVRALEPKAAVAFAGTEDRLEWKAVPQAGYAIHPITVQGFHRKQPLRNLGFPFKVTKGFLQSLGLVRAFDPDVVIGTGGYVAGPVLLAARLLGRPIVIQEQNAFPGVTNKLLGKMATTIHLAFPEATRFFDAKRCVISGNPTRGSLVGVDRGEARRFYDLPETARTLLVFGGSLGSAALNAAMEDHLGRLLAEPDVCVIWQTGSLYYERVNARVELHPRLRLLKYIDRMDMAYAAADAVLSRAGAITCSELMITGTPAILVPSPNVAEDHQTPNARSMADAGAARFLPEKELPERLADEALGLLRDDAGRQAMREAMLGLARPDAARAIARQVLDLIHSRCPEAVSRLF